MPFAGYKDFADCVAKNRDKQNPEAYCASIQRSVEKGRGSAPAEHSEPETPPKSQQHTGWWKGHI